MNQLQLLEELQAIDRNGLHYTTNPYDRERYERLLAVALEQYSQLVALPSEETKNRLRLRLGPMRLFLMSRDVFC